MRNMFSAKRLVLRASACLVLLAIIVFTVCLGTTACSATTASESPSQKRFSWVDDSNNVLVGTDSKTGVEYLVINTVHGVAVTPIVGQNGDI